MHPKSLNSIRGSTYKHIYSCYVSSISQLANINFEPFFLEPLLGQSIFQYACKQLIYDFALDHPVFPSIISSQSADNLIRLNGADISRLLLQNFKQKKSSHKSFIRELIHLARQSAASIVAFRQKITSSPKNNQKVYIYPNRSSVQSSAIDLAYLSRLLPKQINCKAHDLILIGHYQIPLKQSISPLLAIFLFAKIIARYIYYSIKSLISSASIAHVILREASIYYVLKDYLAHDPIILYGSYDTYRPIWSYQNENNTYFLMYSDGLHTNIANLPRLESIQSINYNTLNFLHFHPSSARHFSAVFQSPWQSYLSLQKPISIQLLYSSFGTAGAAINNNTFCAYLGNSTNNKRKTILILDVPPRKEFIFSSFYYNPHYLFEGCDTSQSTAIIFLKEIIESFASSATIVLKSKQKQHRFVQSDYLNFIKHISSFSNVHITDTPCVFDFYFDAVYAMPYTSALHLAKSKKKFFYDPHSIVLEPWKNYFKTTNTKLLCGKAELRTSLSHIDPSIII
jgi:hypothetical protein